MLPGLDGRGVARRIRAFSDVPIIMLTALDDARDKVEGLDIGADDYLTKPFNPDELLARVRAILRRTTRSSTASLHPDRISAGNLEIDPTARRVVIAGDELPLRAKEFDLLLALARHAGMALSRDQLLDLVWDGGFGADTRTVDVHVSRLRERLADAQASVAIETIRSVGYRLTAGH
jgi:DNA-binding response OmpR family regulator